MDVLNKIEAIWRNVSLVQRALLVGVVLTVAVAGVFLTNWATRPDMRLLYSNLDVESAGKITDKVSEKGIAFKLSSDGTSVYVPREHRAQLRLEMSRAGLPDTGQKGYGLFDRQKIGVSPFVQNINMKRALEEELAKSIQYIDGVVHARVHVVTSEHTLFSNQADETTASVVLKLKPGYKLSAMSIAAITHLVAGSVEGVRSDGVTLVDSGGNLLSGDPDQMMSNGAGTVADYKERVEQSLEKKAESMLETVLGPGRASVRVSVEIDMTSDVTRTTTPTKGILKKEEITKSKEPGAAGAAGGAKSDELIMSDYELGATIKEESTPPGEITSRAIAVLVDLSDDDPNVTTPIMALQDVNDIIKNTLGYKSSDSIKVVEAKFRRQEDTSLAEEEAGGLDFVAIAGQASMGIMAICAVVVLKVFKGSKKNAVKPSRTHLPLPVDGGTPALMAGEDSESDEGAGLELMELRRRVGDSLRANPDQAKRLFTSWLEEARS
ncbi:MAG: flagellar M-ring protein FliF [Planctomycetes bacterium]|nr:flagellar M-ring protein FliF [Planctomycetota bacterium]